MTSVNVDFKIGLLSEKKKSMIDVTYNFIYAWHP